MANKHGLSARQAGVRARTYGRGNNKRKVWQFKKFRKITLEFGIQEGILENRNGSTWFRKGRKVNWFTRRKYDNNGKDFYGRDISFKSSYKSWKQKNH
jgi:hypothetical protein